MEQPLDSIDVPPVGEEYDHVVFGFDGRVVMRHDDVFAAYHRHDAGARRQLDLLEPPTDHLRSLLATMHDGLDRFGQTTSQRMHPHHITTTHMRQQ